MAEIEFIDVQKVYDDGTQAVFDFNLEINDGELMVLVGPSGCGKTTALRMVAGLEEISGGELRIGDRVVNDLTPKERNIAMVFQSYALYPHMTVADNLAFGLKLRKLPKDEINERVQRAARILQIEEFLKRKPRALSGGQRQRVAMGRAIVREPEAFLMDEPLSNLDAKLRVGMRAELASLHARVGATTVYVTHDQVEAMTLGDRVAVMRAGRIQQVDSPKELYRHPANLFVASFMGSPAMNLVEARLDGTTLEFGGHRIPLAPEQVPDTRTDEIVLGIRPECFEDARFADPSLPQLDVEVTVLEDLGSDALVVFHLDAIPVHTEELRHDQDEETLLAREGAKFTARVGVATEARPGAPLRLAVDPAGFHYFDRGTGESLRRAVGAGQAAPTPVGS